MSRLRSNINRLNFSLRRNPRILPSVDFRRYIPNPFQSIVLISADFELAWAARYDKSVVHPLNKAEQNADRERGNIPLILEMCERFNIPITWATVGHLFLEMCKPNNGVKHPEIPQVPSYQGPFWDFSGNDWFEHDPCTDYQRDPSWYGSDLLKSIRNSPAQHEIGCHTFSHIDCRDGICPPELMQAELKECKRLAAELDLKLTSFVHPGHTIGNLDVLAQEGFTSFRTDYRNVLGCPKTHPGGLWEFEQTAEFVYRKDWSIDYHIYRYIEIIKRSIHSNTVCVFWFHPSFDSIVARQIWPEVFRFLDEHREELWITTHGAYSKWLNSTSQ